MIMPQESAFLSYIGEISGLVRAWGGLGTLRGGYKITGVACYEDGLSEIEALDAHRQKRGYIPVESLAYWIAQISALRLAGLLPPQAPPTSRQSDSAQGDLLTDVVDGSGLGGGQTPNDSRDKAR